MVFVINELKYDTQKMEMISDKIEYFVNCLLLNTNVSLKKSNSKLWRSKKNNWLLTYKDSYGLIKGVAVTIEDVKKLLIKCDLEKYEEIFGALEEA